MTTPAKENLIADTAPVVDGIDDQPMQVAASDSGSDSLSSLRHYNAFEPSQMDFPYREYQATRIRPCSIRPDGQSSPIHMLDCGHVVAIDAQPDCTDNRCGMNCSHVVTWTKKMDIDLLTGRPLREILHSNASECLIQKPLSLTNKKWLSDDTIFCETCYGIPTSSYCTINRGSGLRRAFALTRTVIEYHTGYNRTEVVDLLAKLFYNPNNFPFDWTRVHVLRCGHVVWAAPTRPCASNCVDEPACLGRNLLENTRQGDMILCRECVVRAENVFGRYFQTGDGTMSGATAGVEDENLDPRLRGHGAATVFAP